LEHLSRSQPKDGSHSSPGILANANDLPGLAQPEQRSIQALRYGLPALESAILHAVAYADVFDYPLTVAEVHRYLVGMPASSAAVGSLLGNGRLVPQRLTRHCEYFTLPGREGIVETRRCREQVAARIWPRALQYSRIMAGLPFVRMVAVTGALAMDNVDPGADIDYFIVTEPGRLWLCRALVILLVRLAAWRGDVICPNYFLSEDALILHERNPYTAHELTQMVPIAGIATYRRMRQLNAWTLRFLPNAQGPPRRVGATALPSDAAKLPPALAQDDAVASGQASGRVGWPWRPARALAEAALKTPPGDWLERWEMMRKMRKFSQHSPALNGDDPGSEAAFCADWCKGHFDNHGQHTLHAYAERLHALEEVDG
jgi:hypothetical protein